MIIVLSKQGILLLFGSKYVLAPTFLSLSLLQFFSVGLGSLSLYSFLNSQGDTSTSFRLNLITVGLDMILGTILTWMWGILGLLVAVFISTMVGNLIGQYLISKKFQIIHKVSHVLSVTIFSAIAGIITSRILSYFGGSNILVDIFLGGISFFTICLILAPLSQAINISDIKILRKVLKKTKYINTIVYPILFLEEKMIQIFG
jgi:O-antigen/teichoic acid export membrane protein